MPPTSDRPTRVLVLWTVLIAVVVVVVTRGVAAGKPVKSLEDGKTGTVEFESLTFPSSAGTTFGLMIRDEDAKPVVVSGEQKIPRAAALRGPASPCISRGVTTGYNSQALDKATKDVKTFLDEVFQLK